MSTGEARYEFGSVPPIVTFSEKGLVALAKQLRTEAGRRDQAVLQKLASVTRPIRPVLDHLMLRIFPGLSPKQIGDAHTKERVNRTKDGFFTAMENSHENGQFIPELLHANILGMRNDVVRGLLLEATHDVLRVEYVQVQALDPNDVIGDLEARLRVREVSPATVAIILNGVGGSWTHTSRHATLREPLTANIEDAVHALRSAPDAEQLISSYAGYAVSLIRSQPVERMVSVVSRARNGARGYATSGNGYVYQSDLAAMMNVSDISRTVSLSQGRATKSRPVDEEQSPSTELQTLSWVTA